MAKKLYVSSNFKTQRVIANGPIRSEFELTYDAWDAGGPQGFRGQAHEHRRRLELHPRAEHLHRGWRRAAHTRHRHRQPRRRRGGQQLEGRLARVLGARTAQKRPYRLCRCGSRGPRRKFTKDKANLLAIASAKPGKPFTYYLGAGWSKSGDFPDAKAWNFRVRDLASRLKSPLVVTVAPK